MNHQLTGHRRGNITFAVIVLALVFWLAAWPVAAESLTPSDREAVRKAAAAAKESFLKKDYDAFVALLYPEMIKAVGGKEKLVELLKAEDARNAAAGLTVESLVFEPTETVYLGTEFKLTFVSTTIIVKVGEARIESKSYYVAFTSLTGGPWYLLDGTRLSMTQFRSLFRGFPEDLKLPAVTKQKL